MPTMTATSVPLNEAPPPEQPALTLSFQGVEFALLPSDEDAVISYRNEGPGVTLKLESFSGSLKVALRGSYPSKLATATVEEEPHTPEIAEKKSTVSPRQQKLSFVQKKQLNKVAASKVKPEKKKGVVDNNRERVTKSNVMPLAKRSRFQLQGQVNPASRKLPKLSQADSGPPSLCQSMDQNISQDINIMELSQTADTSCQSSNGIISNDDQATCRRQERNSSAIKPSVQEILDRVNGSNESIATVGDDENMSDVASVDSDRHPIQRNELPASDEQCGSALQTKEASNSTSMTNEPSFKGFLPPCPRWGHTMTKISGERVLIYGGQTFGKNGHPEVLSDVHIYDTAERTWDKPINCKGQSRQWHSATYLPERELLISFGGESVDEKKKNKMITTDMLSVLDTDIMLWYPPAVSGEIPTGRSGHSATLLPSTNELVVFGGVKGSKWLNSVSVLDTVRWVWSSPKIQGSAPKPRSYHSAVAVKAQGSDASHKLVIFGGNNLTSSFNGVHVLETVDEKWRWSHPTVRGKPPFPRTGHSATLLEDGKTICIYGGWDPNDEECMNEENIFSGSFLLDTNTWTWKSGPKAEFFGSCREGSVSGDCGAKRCGHSAVLTPDGGNVLVFGGRVPQECLAGDFQALPASEGLVGLEDKQVQKAASLDPTVEGTTGSDVRL